MRAIVKQLFLRITVIIGISAFANGLYAASFNCAKASSSIEKLICSNELISKLDDELGQAYGEVKGHTKDDSYLRTEQINWLSIRNECKDASCLEDSYKHRIDELKSVTTTCSVRKFIDLTLRKKDLVEARKMIGNDNCNLVYLPYAISSRNTDFTFYVLNYVKGNPSGETVLGAARAEPEVLVAVVEKGGDINYVNKYHGYYSLLSAVDNNRVSEEKILANVKFLLSKGVNINHIDKFGNSALRHAVVHNYVKVAQYLLEQGADPVQFDGDEEQDGFSIIMVAIKYYETYKDPRVVKELLSRGVDPNSRDGGTYSYECDMNYINKCTWEGYSLLTYAARHNLGEIVRMLLNAGADVNLPRSDGKKAKDIAISIGHKDVLSVLAEFEVNSLD